MIVRQETTADYAVVKEVVRQAFACAEQSDGDEHRLVGRLRESTSFVPELSLVAEEDGRIIGYCMLTKASIRGGAKSTPTLALAPVAVLPEFQGKGAGGAMIRAGLAAALRLGCGSVIVLGHAEYYPRFGFELAGNFGIEPPFDVPPAHFMACELIPGALRGAGGVMAYDEAFFEGGDSL